MLASIAARAFSFSSSAFWYSSTCSIFIAVLLFLYCERSFWQDTTTPDGSCVIRTAESVLFTCWPPAPDAR